MIIFSAIFISYLLYISCRELLVSIRFNEPGWQWSGSFLPDHLGDTQLKMRNYVSGALKTIRVEVQNADVSLRDEKIVGSLHGNSGTNLILLSDDDTGYMPYRIDNFSKEVVNCSICLLFALDLNGSCNAIDFIIVGIAVNILFDMVFVKLSPLTYYVLSFY